MEKIFLRVFIAFSVIILALLRVDVIASEPNYPVLIKTNITKKTLSKRQPRPIAVVVKDVVNEEGQIIIPKGAKVYGVLRNNKKEGLIYIEFVYAIGQNGKKVPVRGYIVGKYLHSTKVGKYLFFFPLAPFFLINDLVLKFTFAKNRMIKRLQKEPREIWITTQ